MMQTLKKEWRHFLQCESGKRFREVHERRQKKRGKRGGWQKIALLVLGWALVLVGTLLLAMPGPGTIVLAGGLMLLASESMSMARMLDYADKKGTECWQRLKGWWKGRTRSRSGRKA